VIDPVMECRRCEHGVPCSAVWYGTVGRLGGVVPISVTLAVWNRRATAAHVVVGRQQTEPAEAVYGTSDGLRIGISTIQEAFPKQACGTVRAAYHTA
jgi:hypothetical protein